MSYLTKGPQLSVQLEPNEANAVVYALSVAAISQGEVVNRLPVSTLPGDLHTLRTECERIAAFAAINDQFCWRAHWGANGGGRPPRAIATEAVWLAVIGELHSRALEHDEDQSLAKFEFDRASRTIAGTFACVEVKA